MGLFKKKKEKKDKNFNRFLEYDKTEKVEKPKTKKEYGQKEKDEYYDDLLRRRKNLPDFSDYVAENLDKSIEYSEYLSGKIDNYPTETDIDEFERYKKKVEEETKKEQIKSRKKYEKETDKFRSKFDRFGGTFLLE